MAYTLNQIIPIVVTGGLLGILGQGVRIVVGLKKFKQDNAEAGIEKPPDVGTIIYSIFLGFTAGAIALLIENPIVDKEKIPTETIILIMSIGYTGADFIEGIFGKYFSKTPASTIPTLPTPAATSDAFELDKNLIDP